MQSDAVLVESVKQGHVAAFEQLVVRYQHAALLVALRVVKDRQEAEDIVQDSFVLAYRHLDSLRSGSKFGPWLLRITAREAVRVAKRQTPAVPVEAVAEPAADSVGAPAQELQTLLELVNRLPRHEQVVVALHYIEGHGVTEISQMTGRPVGTVTKQLSRAIERLRRWVRNEVRQHE